MFGIGNEITTTTVVGIMESSSSVGKEFWSPIAISTSSTKCHVDQGRDGERGEKMKPSSTKSSSNCHLNKMSYIEYRIQF
jgi:hypothetical protein